MKILLDTSILVHAHNAASPYREKAADLIGGAIHREFEACIADQNLYEFFAVSRTRKGSRGLFRPMRPLRYAWTFGGARRSRRSFLPWELRGRRCGSLGG
ncbi:MAG: type II toxin-antitoxin system VapC family toxin [Candidatus Bathyarchaeia archaeon]